MKPARMALRLDALFELALATAVLVPAASGVDLEDAFALNEWAVIGIGALLVPVGLAVWLAKPDRPTLLTIGLANAAGAVIFAVYLVVRADEMNGYVAHSRDGRGRGTCAAGGGAGADEGGRP